MPLPLYSLLALGGVGFSAGFVDSIAGGGGLLTVPALLMAGIDTNLAVGTNKGQSVFGSGMALLRYAHSGLVDRKRWRVSFFPGLIGAACGVELLTLVHKEALRPLVLALLLAVSAFMVFYNVRRVRLMIAALAAKVGATGSATHGVIWKSALIAFVIGGYDGFFGPGTGTFLILAYALVFGDPLDVASANAKVVNFASNLASMILFAMRGWILWPIALAMGVGQAAGAFTGAHVTIKKGQGVVRWMVLAVSLALLGKVAWDWWHG